LNRGDAEVTENAESFRKTPAQISAHSAVLREIRDSRTTNKEKTMKTKTAILTILAALIVCGSALCAVPPMINYQGKLMQPSGAPVPDNTYTIQFAIYADPTGGTALWSETNSAVQVKGGLFAVLLGSVTPLPADIFDGANRFFGVKVGTDSEMTPRQQVASAAFAIKASSADVATTVPDGAITTDKMAALSVSSPKIAPGAVDGSKIAPLAVTSDKIGPGAVSTNLLAPNAVTAAKIEAQEPWHEIGAAGEPPFKNGWVNFPGYDGVAYMKDSLGFVHLKGLMKGGTTGAVPAFTLPAGYRPTLRQIYRPWSDTDAPNSRVDIVSNGDIDVQSGSIVALSLSGITLKAEQ
jgi:hypothetical protein